MFLKKKKSVTYIFKLCEVDIITVTVMTVLVSMFDNYLPNDQAFPLTIPSLLGTALSLVLAFRTGQAYDRWWEARKIWGAIVNDSRSLVRAAKGFVVAGVKTEDETNFVNRLGMRQIAWVYALGRSLRNQNELDGLEEFLPLEEIESIKSKNNIPNAILEYHSADIKQANANGLITDFGQLRLDEIVMRNVDSMGMCERIKGTIFPSPYNRFVHLTIYVFAITLTVGITDFAGYIEIPATIVITSLFLALERIAVLLQDPFENNPSDIPVSTISNKIEFDLKQMMGNDNLPKPVLSNGYYVM